MTHLAFKIMPEALYVCSRWLSAATAPDLDAKKKCGLHTGRGARIVGRVVARAPQPPATGFNASGIVSIKTCRL